MLHLERWTTVVGSAARLVWHVRVRLLPRGIFSLHSTDGATNTSGAVLSAYSLTSLVCYCNSRIIYGFYYNNNRSNYVANLRELCQ